MKFFVDYFGCRSNQAEVQEWIIQLENAGYQNTSSCEEADFAILNTCSVTAHADRDVWRYLSNSFRNTGCTWFVAGCTVTKEKSALSDRFPNFVFLDNQEKLDLIDVIQKRFPVQSNLIFHSSFKSRFFLKVQDGCNFRCSFCIVPSLRGKSRSTSRKEILNKARYYLSLGYKEIVLTGINLSSYGYDLFPRESLTDLIQEIHELPDLEVLRISSLDPRFIRYETIKKLSELPKLADSFHFSFQSGSDAILKEMKRGGKTSENIAILRLFRRFFPDSNLGADIIVGFPGEEERDFRKTVHLIEQGDLNYLHLFPFSPRENTPAASLPQIPKEIIQYRLRELKELNSKVKLAYRERMIGKRVESIVIDDGSAYSLAVSKNFLSIRVPDIQGYKKRKLQIMVTRVLNENLCEGKLA